MFDILGREQSVWMGNVASTICNGFKWREDMLNFNEESPTYDDNKIGHILEVGVKYLEQLHELSTILPVRIKKYHKLATILQKIKISHTYKNPEIGIRS